jgi:hypothetical protein
MAGFPAAGAAAFCSVVAAEAAFPFAFDELPGISCQLTTAYSRSGGKEASDTLRSPHAANDSPGFNDRQSSHSSPSDLPSFAGAHSVSETCSDASDTFTHPLVAAFGPQHQRSFLKPGVSSSAMRRFSSERLVRFSTVIQKRRISSSEIVSRERWPSRTTMPFSECACGSAAGRSELHPPPRKTAAARNNPITAKTSLRVIRENSRRSRLA